MGAVGAAALVCAGRIRGRAARPRDRGVAVHVPYVQLGPAVAGVAPQGSRVRRVPVRGPGGGGAAGERGRRDRYRRGNRALRPRDRRGRLPLGGPYGGVRRRASHVRRLSRLAGRLPRRPPRGPGAVGGAGLRVRRLPRRPSHRLPHPRRHGRPPRQLGALHGAPRGPGSRARPRSAAHRPHEPAAGRPHGGPHLPSHVRVRRVSAALLGRPRPYDHSRRALPPAHVRLHGAPLHHGPGAPHGRRGHGRPAAHRGGRGEGAAGRDGPGVRLRHGDDLAGRPGHVRHRPHRRRCRDGRPGAPPRARPCGGDAAVAVHGPDGARDVVEAGGRRRGVRGGAS